MAETLCCKQTVFPLLWGWLRLCFAVPVSAMHGGDSSALGDLGWMGTECSTPRGAEPRGKTACIRGKYLDSLKAVLK